MKQNRIRLFSRTEVPFPYPSSGLNEADHFSENFPHALLSRWRSYQVKKRPHDSGIIFSLAQRAVRALLPSDIPLIFLTRNSFPFLKSFLAHYRSLGVTRFLCVDDQSTDGTREMLLGEPDVEIFGSNVRYKDANRGLLWREALTAIFGIGRWYLNVDCDEYFIYADYETRKLPELIKALEIAGITHGPAPMIDCYPEDSVASAVLDGTSDQMPWEIAGMFDRSGYRLLRTSSGMIMSGGPRDRILGRPAIHDELMKYPLIYVQYETTLSVSIHKPWPFMRNFSPIIGSLLHFKFFSDTEKMIKEAIRDDQYHKGARSYKNMLQAMAEGKLNYLNSDISSHFENSQQMKKLGFFKSPFE